MNKNLFGLINISYLIKFVIVFLGLYYLNSFVIGITTPGGIYYPFVADYLNYPVWIRTAVLFVSEQVTHLFGYQSHLKGALLVNDSGTKSLEMSWPCYGLALMSFWFAFVISHADPMRDRLKWVLIGFLGIFLINVTRISLLYISLIDGWSIGRRVSMTNHDVFNYASYLCLAVFILVYNRKESFVAQPAQAPAAIA